MPGVRLPDLRKPLYTHGRAETLRRCRKDDRETSGKSLGGDREASGKWLKVDQEMAVRFRKRLLESLRKVSGGLPEECTTIQVLCKKSTRMVLMVRTGAQ